MILVVPIDLFLPACILTQHCLVQQNDILRFVDGNGVDELGAELHDYICGPEVRMPALSLLRELLIVGMRCTLQSRLWSSCNSQVIASRNRKLRLQTCSRMWNHHMYSLSASFPTAHANARPIYLGLCCRVDD